LELKVEILKNGEVIETKEFADGSFKIGRSSACEINLKSPQISKQHALLVIKGDRAAVVDLGSSNGIFVNGILVRKQRIEVGDEVAIADFRLRVANEVKASAGFRPPPRRPTVDEGNLARQSFESPESPPPEAVSPQEKLIQIMDEKVLVPFYSVMKTMDWRFLLLSILGFALLAAVLLSVIPIVRWGRAITTTESLARAHTVVGQTVRENYRIITKTNDFTRLTVEAAEAEQGIINCYIVDPNSKTILAPVKLMNKSIENDAYTLIAIKRVIDGKEEVVSVPVDSDRYVVAQPIYIYTQEQSGRNLVGVVVASFEIPTKVYSTFEPMVEAALFAILCSLLAYFLIFKMFTYPIVTMQEQLDAALKGEDITVTAEAKCAELETLATVINFSVSRVKQGGGGLGAQPLSSNDPEAEDGAYKSVIEEMDKSTSDALLLLDKDKRVAFVGRALEELVGMRNQMAQGQNITDACRDASFAGTVVDMAESVFSSLGEMQYSSLDINGIARNVVAQPHKNSGGEIRFILVTVKLGSA